MATIPIEIVLQDAEVPVDPTPEEETNIVVPDTGTISNEKDSGGISSSVGIILPIVIAILAIVTAIVLMIRKHHNKYFSSVINRKEKLATVVSSTIAILAVTVLVGNLLIPVTSAATDDTNHEGKLIVDDKITITITREAGSNEAIVSSIDTKSYATVYKTFGYEVAIAMAGNSANLYLDGDESSDHYFSPVEDSTLTDNTWGYTLDGEEYTAMPLINNLAVVARGATPVSDKEVDINYSVKVSSDMPNGTYTGEIEYILADTGFPAALRTMQDMTTSICSSVPTPNPFKADNTTIEDNVPTIMLKDIRDNKFYRVAKLADGKCWMTQNLDLQKEDLVVASLDSTNTDNPADGFTLPISQVSGSESWGEYDSKTDIETTHVYSIEQNPENPYRYCIDFQMGRCQEYGNEIPTAELGNLYNWHTATSGTGTYEVGSGDDKEASGSICPAGWRLPNNSNSGEATDYSTLLYQYGIIENPTTDSYMSIDKVAIYKAPLIYAPTGTYNDGLLGVGINDSLWSSLANDNTSARFLGLRFGYVGLWGSNDKIRGQAVRCVAR